jgi:tetratricopeptide (TPR) repeat protein
MRKPTRFDEIKQIYDQLIKAEKEILHSQLSSFELLSLRSYEDVSKLMRALQMSPDANQAAVIYSAGLKGKSTAEINSLLLLTRDYLLDQLLSDVNIERQGAYSKKFRVKISIAKRVQQAHILMSRGLDQQAEKLLEEAVNKGEKYELFDICAEAMGTLQFIQGVEKGKRTFNKYAAEIDKMQKKGRLVQETQQLYSYFKATQYKDNLNKDNLSSELAEITNGLEKLESNNKVHTVAYTSYITQLLRMETTMLQGDLKKAENIALKLLTTISKKAAVESEEREGFALVQLSEIQINLKKFNQARIGLNRVLSITPRADFESYLSLKYLTLIDFYEHKHEDLKQSLPKLVKSKFTLSAPYSSVQFHYYSSVLQFVSGNFKDGATQLMADLSTESHTNNEIELGTAILLFMSGVELRRLNDPLSNSALTTAHKALQRLKEQGDLSKRDRSILKLTEKLHDDQYSFVKTLQLSRNLFSALPPSNTETSWKPLTYEVIPFDQWFMTVVNAQKADKSVKVVPKKSTTLKAKTKKTPTKKK